MPFLETPDCIRFLVLGSGTSTGVPMIGCDCPVCLSPDPMDHRTRSSLYVQTPLGGLLVDTTPDLRQQALREGLRRVDAILITHAHADHILGFDDVRRFCEISNSSMPVYGNASALETLTSIYYYGFQESKKIPGYINAVAHVMSAPISLAGLDIVPLPLPHGRIACTGFLFLRRGRKLLAYMTDCHNLTSELLDLVTGSEVIILDAVRDKPHLTHFNVEQAIQAAQTIGAPRTFFTHISHDKSHAERSAELPPGISLAYDGLRLESPWT